MIFTFTFFQIRSIYISEGWTATSLPAGWLAKGDTKNYMFVAPNGTRMKGKVQAMAFLDNNGGSEQEKKQLAELNMLTKKTTIKEEEMKSTKSNGKRAKFQPPSRQQASLLAAFETNSLPSAEAKKALAEQIGMAVKSVGFWFVNYRAKITKKGKVAALPEAKEEEKENVEVEKVSETKFGSENEALELISLLPGVNIKPIFKNKVVSDEKEPAEEEKKLFVVDEEVSFNFNTDESLNDEDTEVLEEPTDTEEPFAMEVEPANNEAMSENEDETKMEANSDAAVEKESLEVDDEAAIPDSVTEALEEADQIEVEEVDNETIEAVSELENEKESQSTNEGTERNQNETLPKGWKKIGFC